MMKILFLLKCFPVILASTDGSSLQQLLLWRVLNGNLLSPSSPPHVVTEILLYGGMVSMRMGIMLPIFRITGTQRE